MSGFSMPLEYEFGPDGALYVVEYGGPYFGASAGTKLTKLEYTGTCRPAEPTLPPLNVAVRPGARQAGKVVLSGIDLGLQREVTLPAEAKGLRVFDVQGRIVWEYSVPGGNALATGLSVPLPADLGQGLYRVGFLY
jgi:hypothetical protein